MFLFFKCFFYHVDELREFQFNLDGQGVADVGHRSDEFVVVGEEIVVEPFSVRIPRHRCFILNLKST